MDDNLENIAALVRFIDRRVGPFPDLLDEAVLSCFVALTRFDIEAHAEQILRKAQLSNSVPDSYPDGETLHRIRKVWAFFCANWGRLPAASATSVAMWFHDVFVTDDRPLRPASLEPLLRAWARHDHPGTEAPQDASSESSPSPIAASLPSSRTVSLFDPHPVEAPVLTAERPDKPPVSSVASPPAPRVQPSAPAVPPSAAPVPVVVEDQSSDGPSRQSPELRDGIHVPPVVSETFDQLPIKTDQEQFWSSIQTEVLEWARIQFVPDLFKGWFSRLQKVHFGPHGLSSVWAFHEDRIDSMRKHDLDHLPRAIILDKQPDRPVWFIGDVHGDLPAFIAGVRAIKNRDPSALIVLLGDIVDDRILSMASVMWILSYATRHRGDVLWLAGNHDAGVRIGDRGDLETNASGSHMTFVDWMNRQRRTPSWSFFNDSVMSWFVDLFESLPHCMLLPNGLLAVHAGTPVMERQLDRGMPLMRGMEASAARAACFWNRMVDKPSAFQGRNHRSSRDVGHKQVEEFADWLQRQWGHELSCVVHGHDHVGFIEAPNGNRFVRYRCQVGNRQIPIMTINHMSMTLDREYVPSNFEYHPDDIHDRADLLPNTQSSSFPMWRCRRSVMLRLDPSEGILQPFLLAPPWSMQRKFFDLETVLLEMKDAPSSDEIAYPGDQKP